MKHSASVSYEGELASSILFEDGDGAGENTPGSSGLKSPSPFVGFDSPSSGYGGSPLFGGGFGGIGSGPSGGCGRQSARGLPPHQRADGQAPNRTPTRTPSPVYQWSHGGGKGGFGDAQEPFQAHPGKSSSSTATGSDPQVNPLFPGSMGYPSLFPGVSPMWAQAQAAQAYYGMMMNNPLMGQQAAAANVSSGQPAAASDPSKSNIGIPPMEPNVFQMMMALQAPMGGAAVGAQTAAPGPMSSSSHPMSLQAGGNAAFADDAEDQDRGLLPSERQALPPGPQPLRASGGLGGGAPGAPGGDARRMKSRNKDKEAAAVRPQQPQQLMQQQQQFMQSQQQPQQQHQLQQQQHEPGMISTSKGGAGGKGDKNRRRGGSGGGQIAPAEAADGGAGGKSRLQPSSPIIEQLKARERNIELSDLSLHITEIAQDQYGSRLIQQKLEVASDDEKQLAFKSVLQKMPQLTTDVFGNYVIQKFFEYGSSEQRRILAEQLVGQVLKLSLQMYGCRVVQKALDSVPIEQQVLLIGELKGNVIKCIEDQHGNHVIQKCIERLPTDRIGFIVDSFLGQAARMAKHCYGCRVMQRLIEYCASTQISALLDEVLRCSMELATDQYGNYVVQHVMEHSSRPGDRQHVMGTVRKNILTLSCHKYASNVIEKALSCATYDERSLLVAAIVGEQSEQHPPLLVMMRDRFGNYIVQRVIALAQGPQRDMLFWKLREHMPALKKSNTYGKHIISALERAQAGIRD